MKNSGEGGRQNQKMRTRNDLLKAAGELMKQGSKPSIDEIAVKAMVSRATAYRYFPTVEALLAEASVDISMLAPGEFFSGNKSRNAVERLEHLDGALHDLILANEPALRMMLATSMERALRGDAEELPARQNRRTPLILEALAPERPNFTPAMRKLLTNALALVIGTESMVVTRDVLRLDDAEARKTRRWAIRALVEAARRASS